MVRLLLLLLLLPTPLPALDNPGDEAYDYPSRWGTVTFAHFDHQRRTGDCKTCHHLGVELGGCRSCHGVIQGLPQHRDVLHKTCIDCHWQRKGPTECGGCHDPARLVEPLDKAS